MQPIKREHSARLGDVVPDFVVVLLVSGTSHWERAVAICVECFQGPLHVWI